MDEVSPFEPTVVTAVRQQWRLVVVVTLLFTVLGGLYGFTRPKSYTATATLSVSDPTGPGVLAGQSAEPPDRYVADQLPVFSSVALSQRAAQRGREQKPPLRQSPSWYRSNISAFANAADNNLLSVSFSAPDNDTAMAGLRATVAAYSDVTKAAMANKAQQKVAQIDSQIRRNDQRVDGLRQEIIDNPDAAPVLQSQIDAILANRGTATTNLDQVLGEASAPSNGIEQALLPNSASAPGKSSAIRYVLLGFVLGLMLGVGLAYLRSYRKRVFMHQRDPELLLHAPLLIDASGLHAVDLLGIAPNADGPFAGQAAQDLFGIAASLLVDQNSNGDQRGTSLAVISAKNGASCTAVSWRLGLALASQGLRALLIDVEAAWPPVAPWMAQVVDRLPWEENDEGKIVLGAPRVPTRRSGPFVGRQPTGGSEVMPYTGPWKAGLYVSNEAPPVSSQKELRTVFRDLEKTFDVVLINAPPFLPSADAAHLTSAAGATMVVVPAGASVNDHEELVRRLDLAAARTIGYVYCCSDCDVPNPPPATGDRLKRVLHVERAGVPQRKVSGLKPT